MAEGRWAVRRDAAVQAAAREGLVSDGCPLAAFVDLAGIAETAEAVRAAWPTNLDVRHAFAAKANCLVPVLRILRGHGFGCEVASAGELAQAVAAGFTPEALVLDSPAKTVSELTDALSSGIAVNVDNLQELARIDAILHDQQSTSNIGIRINPQVGTGGIESTSTAGEHSKFGVALQDPGARAALLDAYLQRPWLRVVHVHVGSQGCPLKMIGEGVAAVVDFAEEVNRRAGERRITGVNVGGGLTVDFEGESVPDFRGHAKTILATAPALAGGGYSIVTEYGRSVMAKNGFMVSKVEYTKTAGGRRIALTHIGSNVAARTVFAPSSWPLRVLAYDSAGVPKAGSVAAEVHDVAGPCCFAGDLVATERLLPRLEQGDVVVVPDTGAYYFSAPYRYNSVPMGPVYGFEVEPEVRFTLLAETESATAMNP